MPASRRQPGRLRQPPPPPTGTGAAAGKAEAAKASNGRMAVIEEAFEFEVRSCIPCQGMYDAQSEPVKMASSAYRVGSTKKNHLFLVSLPDRSG